MKRIVIERSGVIVAEPLEVALTGWQRFRGLMFRGGMGPEEGLLIPGCRSVHTFFMRFPIDLAYLDGEMAVARVVEGLKPWRLSWCRGAHAVLELSAGRAAEAGLAAGDRLGVRQAEPG
jgi:uncharacterized membrane protein (UPF0127 family)